MPVWLDAIPEKAAQATRPVTWRWLLFLVLALLLGGGLTFWNWEDDRAGFVFWFTSLGLPFCVWGLSFSVRRLAYKAEQVGVASHDAARDRLIKNEVARGRRRAWILGRYVQTFAGDGPGKLLNVAKQSVPVMYLSPSRGSTVSIRYAALPEFQQLSSNEVQTIAARLASRIQDTMVSLPRNISCWLTIECDSDIIGHFEKQLMDELVARTERHFHFISGNGLTVFDQWLDRCWEKPGVLVIASLSLPVKPREGDADAISVVVLSNRKAASFPDALRLHRPEKGTVASIGKTFRRALLWANIQVETLQGSWISGSLLVEGGDWNKACEENGVTFSLSERNSCIDPVLGYAGRASGWLAIILAESAFDERGPQVIAVQPDANKDDIWITIITKEAVSKESPGNV